ncbi:MAG: WGR domain-containing protein [Paracoccaceae bacterium]
MELPVLLTFLMIRNSRPRARFYRVEIAYNLFGEYSVVREWGPKGRGGHHLLVWFSNLRDACQAAERWRKRAACRGYIVEGKTV